MPSKSGTERIGRPTSGVTETHASIVYRKLRNDILTGKFEPGGRLRIELLMERYGVGASPTREALNRLSAESFVNLHDQRGFHVAPVSLEELLELGRTRTLLNDVVLRESIALGDEAWEDQVILTGARLLRTPRNLPDGSINPLWEDRHRSFHGALFSACGSRWLVDMMETLFDCADRYRHLSAVVGPDTRDIGQEHQELMDAVLSRDADRAVKLLNEHIARTVDVLVNSTKDFAPAVAAPPVERPAARRTAPSRRGRRPAAGG